MTKDTLVPSTQSTFVGREREMAQLCAGLEEARGGLGRFFLVTGGPGIGKTRLAAEVARRAASSAMAVLRAGCWEGVGAPAYWPFIQVIRAALRGSDREALLKRLSASNAVHVAQDLAQLIPELQPPNPVVLSGQPSPDPEQSRFRLFDSVATVVTEIAGHRPLMLIIEDLHDADQPSVLMLRFVVSQLKDAPVLVLCTYRDVEVQRSPALSQLIGDLTREGTQVPLFGLSREDAARMIAERAGAQPIPRLVSDIHQATAGNPLFIDGLLRVMAGEGRLESATRLNLAAFRVPDGVREAMRRWLALVSDRSPLVVAATIGQQFELRCLQLVTQFPNHQLLDALREASDMGIVVPVSRGAYEFSHALIRNALSDELNSGERARLHLRIGEALEELYVANVEAHVAELAHHFHEGGDINKAIDYSVRAGEAARAVFAYEEAAAHWQAALELMPESAEDRERRANLLERLGELLGMSASEGAEQVLYLEQAVKLYEDLGRMEAAARVHSRLAGWHMTRNNPDIAPALEHNRKAQDYLTEAPEGFSAVLLNIGLSATAVLQQRYDEALTASSRAMELSEQLRDEIYWARAACAHAAALCYTGRLAEAFVLLGRIRTKGDQLDDSLATFGASACACGVLIALLDPVKATAWVEPELAKSRISQASFLQKTLFECLGISQALMGKLAEAARLVAEAQGGSFLEGRQLEGQLAFYQGAWQRAELIFTQALNHELQANRLIRSSAYSVFAARVLRTQGRQLEAEPILEKALAMCIKGPDLLIEMQARQELAVICVTTERLEQAHLHLARCREILAAGEDWRGLEANTLRAEAMLAVAEKRWEDAQGQFAKAVQIYRRYQVPFEEAEALHYWGRALLAAADHEEALEKLDAAIELYRHHGAGEGWLEGVQTDRLRAQGSGTAAESKKPLAVCVPQLRDGPKDGSVAEAGNEAGPKAVFRREGEYWTLSWAGPESRLKHSKGLHYLAWLLRHPGQELSAQSLVSAIEPGNSGPLAAGSTTSSTIATDLGDVGAALDPAAKAQYRHRLEDLRDELELAEQLNDLGRAGKARHEIEFIEAEVAAAVGLGGRDRKHASHAERARMAVTKAIKSALGRIRHTDPELGRHLSLSIQTGYFCSYLPRQPITWQL